jgi:PHS family inorganic phosphate transporter-like MFS transporter
MSIVLVLQVVAAFASACSFSLTLEGKQIISTYEVLAFWRFILGLGCGGSYPLAATLTTEVPGASQLDTSKLVALTFSLQGVGYVFVPIVSLVIATIFGESDWSWRIILATGCIPGALLTYTRIRNMQYRPIPVSDVEISIINPHKIQQAAPPIKRTVSVFEAIRTEKNLTTKLIGTAGIWLLLDVIFYGNTLFQTVILADAFGDSKTVIRTARDSFVIGMMALPGYFTAVCAIGHQSIRTIQIQGFFAMGVLYLCIGVLYDELVQQPNLLLMIYGATFFCSNYGPNATTFMLPSMTFSRECRSTLNGVCAASGKVGALLGAYFFVPASRTFGMIALFFACAVISFVRCIITLVCVRRDVGLTTSANKVGNGMYTVTEVRLNEVASTALKVVYSEPCFLDYTGESD